MGAGISKRLYVNTKAAVALDAQPGDVMEIGANGLVAVVLTVEPTNIPRDVVPPQGLENLQGTVQLKGVIDTMKFTVAAGEPAINAGDLVYINTTTQEAHASALAGRAELGWAVDLVAVNAGETVEVAY